MYKKLTIEKFKLISSERHNNKYDYSQTELQKDNKIKVKIICPEHGIFYQSPNNHMRGQKCPTCANKFKYSSETFIKKSIEQFGDEYDYSLVNYKDNKTPVKFICKKHGIFEQIPQAHLSSKIPCFKCTSENRRHTNEEIINRFAKAHGERYDYSLVEFQTLHKKVKIICKKHGIFEQKPEIHLLVFGCKKCKLSKGELEVMNKLNEIGINYEFQYKFEECKNKKKLPFDFYLPDFRCCIEYNGIQHYEPIEWFGGYETFEKVKINDKIKQNFCQKKNIKLIIIKYDEDISSKLIF